MIYVCIPSHNEATTLGPLLWKVQKVFRAFGREFGLLVLDDGSEDEPAEVLNYILEEAVNRREHGLYLED